VTLPPVIKDSDPLIVTLPPVIKDSDPLIRDQGL